MDIHPDRTALERWLLDGEPNEISPGHVVLLLNSLGEPAVLAPSSEATITANEEHPAVEDETYELELKSLVVVWEVEAQHWNVENPNEDPGARFAPSKEDSIPEPVPNEVCKDQTDAEAPPG